MYVKQPYGFFLVTKQPYGFEDKQFSDHAYKLKKSMHGPK